MLLAALTLALLCLAVPCIASGYLLYHTAELRRLEGQRLLHGVEPGKPIPVQLKPELLPDDIPDDVLLFCSGESEPWARADLLAKARRLHAEHGDWSTVLRLLAGDEEGVA